MELNHLKYFYTVARERSFTRAAKVLRVQQPTISKMVRNLEEQLRLTLLERHKQGVQLTQAGGDVFEACQEIFGHIEKIQLVADQQVGELEGPLAFGATDSVCSYLVPKAIAAYLRKNPKVRPSIFAGNSNLILSEILEGRIEFGLSFTSPNTSGFHTEDLLQIPFQLVIATPALNASLIRRSFVISRDIDYPKSRPFPVLEMLRKNKVRIETFISSNNLDTQKQMVKEGLGVSLLPGFMIKSGLEKGTLTSVYPRKHFSYSLKLIHRKGRILTRNSVAFLDAFKRIAPELIS